MTASDTCGISKSEVGLSVLNILRIDYCIDYSTPLNNVCVCVCVCVWSPDFEALLIVSRQSFKEKKKCIQIGIFHHDTFCMQWFKPSKTCQSFLDTSVFHVAY